MPTDPSTLLFLHAHPDDECILTGATIAKAHALGHRVVVCYATHGDAGVTSKDLGEDTLGMRRAKEARAACAELGVDRVLFLEFDDSGMAGSDTASSPSAFCNVDLDEILARLSIALVNETITAVVGYDRNGTYGHPDHLRIHEVAHAAAPVLRARWVLDATYNRDYLATLEGDAYDKMEEDFEAFAAGEAELTHLVQGLEWFMAKGAAIRHHYSQMPDDWEDDDPTGDGGGPDMQGFADRFGVEWFIAAEVDSGQPTTDLGSLNALFEPKSAWTGDRLVLP